MYDVTLNPRIPRLYEMITCLEMASLSKNWNEVAKMIIKQLMIVYLSVNYRHLGFAKAFAVFTRDIVPVFIEFTGPNPG